MGKLPQPEEAGLPLFCSNFEDRAHVQAVPAFMETSSFFEKEVPGLQSEAVTDRMRWTASHTGKRQNAGMQSNLVAAVAVVLILISIGLLAFKNNPVQNGMQHMTILNKAQESEVQLPDGTGVCLSAGSRLSYSRDFGTASREVTLEGAAFFDVAADAEHPFIVHTKAFDIEAGTAAFNLRAYKGAPAGHITLQRGQAAIQLKNNGDKKMILQPDDSISVPNTSEAAVEACPEEQCVR